MRVTLIAPAIEELRVNGNERPRGDKVFRFSLLSLLTVAACTDDKHEVLAIDEQVEPIDFDADVDLVGISFMTAHAPRASK